MALRVCCVDRNKVWMSKNVCVLVVPGVIFGLAMRMTRELMDIYLAFHWEILERKNVDCLCDRAHRGFEG